MAMPTVPTATQPRLSRRWLSLAHSTEPLPMPTENRVSIRLNTLSLPPRCSLVKVGSWVVYTAPINQNQEMPMMAA